MMLLMLSLLLFLPGAGNMIPVIMKVTSGKRPSVEMIPEDKPQECDEMIDIMRCCWKQEVADRPPFSGKTQHKTT